MLNEKNENGNLSMQIKNLRERYNDEQLSVIDKYLDILSWTQPPFSVRYVQ